MTHATVELGHVTVSVEGTVTSGGSSRHDSDEPPWVEVEIDSVHNDDTGVSMQSLSFSPLEVELMEEALYNSWIEE